MRAPLPWAMLALALAGGAQTARAQQPLAAQDDDLRGAVVKLQQEVAAQRARLEQQTLELEQLRQTSPPALFRVGGLRVRASGFIQIDGVAYHDASVDELDPSTGEPLNRQRFSIPRARLRVDADYKWMSAILELDGNTAAGPTARVTNAEVSAQWPAPRDGAPPYVQGTFGLLRIPFGFEVQQRDFVRLFLDRSNVVHALFPGEFDLGFRVQGGWHVLRYQVAALNGNPADDRQFAARDPNRSKDLVARLGIDVAIGRRLDLQVGLSGVYGRGFSPGVAATKDTLVWRDTNLDGQVDPTELVAVPGQPATAAKNFARHALGADVRVTVRLPRLGELELYGELISASNLDRGLHIADPVTTGRNLRELGGYVAVTQQLTRWAMLGVRYDRYDPDRDATDRIAASVVPRDASFTTIAVAAAAIYAPYGRLVVEYDHHWNALGRRPSGAPATLGGNVLTFRAQAQF